MTTRSHYIDVPPSDFNAIVDALYRFGAGQDLRDEELFSSAFADGAVLDFVQPAARLGVDIAPFEGREAIAETVMTATEPLTTSHTVTNPRITAYDGQKARLFALVEAQHLPKEDHGRHLMLKNVYLTDLSRDGDIWRIDHMKIETLWIDGDPAVLFPVT